MTTFKTFLLAACVLFVGVRAESATLTITTTGARRKRECFANSTALSRDGRRRNVHLHDSERHVPYTLPRTRPLHRASSRPGPGMPRLVRRAPASSR